MIKIQKDLTLDYLRILSYNKKMARVTFSALFRQHDDGSLEPTREVRISGTTIRPGLRFRDTSFGGVNLSSSQFLGHDFEVNFDQNVAVIVGIYQDVNRRETNN